jgi:hypothetical protein
MNNTGDWMEVYDFGCDYLKPGESDSSWSDFYVPANTPFTVHLYHCTFEDPETADRPKAPNTLSLPSSSPSVTLPRTRYFKFSTLTGRNKYCGCVQEKSPSQCEWEYDDKRPDCSTTTLPQNRMIIPFSQSTPSNAGSSIGNSGTNTSALPSQSDTDAFCQCMVDSFRAGQSAHCPWPYPRQTMPSVNYCSIFLHP